MDAERTVRDKWRLLKPTMDERAQRLWSDSDSVEDPPANFVDVTAADTA